MYIRVYRADCVFTHSFPRITGRNSFKMKYRVDVRPKRFSLLFCKFCFSPFFRQRSLTREFLKDSSRFFFRPVLFRNSLPSLTDENEGNRCSTLIDRSVQRKSRSFRRSEACRIVGLNIHPVFSMVKKGLDVCKKVDASTSHTAGVNDPLRL